jgi:hypothetical protein
MRGKRFPHFLILIAASCGFVGAAAGQTVSPASADAGTTSNSSAALAPTAKAVPGFEEKPGREILSARLSAV